MDNVVVKIDDLLNNNLNIEEYLILFFLKRKAASILIKYKDVSNNLNKEFFLNLENKGFLTIKDKLKPITFVNLELTEKGNSLLDDKLDLKFSEFRKFYPVFFKQGIRVRRFQKDLNRCKKLYSEALKIYEHDDLCKAARKYKNEMISSGSEQYIQDMASWLHQKNYETYIDNNVLDNDLEVGEGGFFRDL